MLKLLKYMNFKEFFEKLLSGYNGHPSSKRLVGAFVIVAAIGCVIFLTIVEHGTSTVENLLTTAMVIGASLLGISSVTGIWKKDNNNQNNKTNNQDK